jgi:GT2 family glycosyltransferase
MIVVGNYCYGGNQALAEIFREDLHLNGVQLKLCHEYPNADFPYHHDTIFDFIDSCDIIILPARTRIQPFKSVNRLALAWSRKKPVVIPPLDAYTKYARDGYNCLIADTQDAFLKAIYRLKEDKPLRDRLAAQGFSTAITALNPRTHVDKLLHELRGVGLGASWSPDTFVQIIIPHYANRLDYLTLAVKAAVESKGPPRDILVVSSSKSNPTTALAKYPDVRVHYSDSRLSFSQANNVGLTNPHPKTTHFLLLNDDTIMSKNALGGYFEVLKDRNIILNPYSNCDKGWLHNDKLEVNGFDLHPNQSLEEFKPQDLAALLSYEPSRDQEINESNFCAFYATLIPKEMTDRVGLLSGKFVNGGEDLDYCYRAKNLLKASCYWTRNAFVYHFGGKTRKFSEDENYEQHHAEDRYNHSMVQKRWPEGKKRVGIWAGQGWEHWDLMSYREGGRGLGGSETCAGRLAEICADEGHYTTLYGEFAGPSEQFGVELIPWRHFVPEEEFFDTFIALRSVAPIDERLKARRKLVWIHDLFILSGQVISDYHLTVVDKFIVLSPFHKRFVMDYHKLPESKIDIIPNGVNVEIFN